MNDGPVTFELDGPEAVERRSASIAADRREAEHVRERIGRVDAELASLESEIEAALDRLDREQDDVRDLQRFTLRGILADLRGEKDDAMRREIAEVAEVRYEVATLRDRQSTAVRELDALQDRLVALGDLDAEWIAVQEARRSWIGESDDDDDAVGARLAEIADALGDLEHERRECGEARVAAVEALARLDEVDDALTDAAPELADESRRDDRLELVCDRVRTAEDALRGLATELHDVGVDLATPEVVQRWDRAFDAFFTGLVVDESLAERLAGAAAIVDHAQERVGQVAADVEGRSKTVSTREDELFEERSAILERLADTRADEM